MTLTEVKDKIIRVKQELTTMVQEQDITADEANILFPIVIELVFRNEYIKTG